MGKQTGITRYTCDRCGTIDHLPDNASVAAEWKEIAHIMEDGARNDRILCKTCHADWRKLAKAQDADFNQFMSGKDKNKEGQGQ